MNKKIIGLHNSDKTKFPNLALMKLSAFYKNHNIVKWYNLKDKFDIIYSSKIFTYSKGINENIVNIIKGGSGYDLNIKLTEEIEHIMPDYSLYNLNYSLGFTTRGCNRNCKWCIVPIKEGKIKAHTEIKEFLKHNKLILMDNNILAIKHGIKQLEQISNLEIKLDINQGIDARLIDNSIAKLFSKIKWLKPVRLSCDTIEQITHIEKAVKLLRWHNVKPSRYFCYVLIDDDIESAIERIKFLKKLYIDPFVQPYINNNGDKPLKIQRDFARYVNHKAIFYSITWNEYKEKLSKEKKIINKYGQEIRFIT